MIRIRLAHGDRSVELTADLNDSTHVVQCRNIARELWAVVIAAGPTTPPDPDPPRVEAGGMGFTADLADQPRYARPAPDLVPGVPGAPEWDPEDDRTTDLDDPHRPEWWTRRQCEPPAQADVPRSAKERRAQPGCLCAPTGKPYALCPLHGSRGPDGTTPPA